MLQKVLFNALAVGFLLLTAYVIFVDTKWSAAGRGMVAFFAAALCALIGNIESIETLKVSASGVEGRTRELVHQAENAVNELHELAAMTGTILVQLIASGYRLAGPEVMVEKQNQKSLVLDRLHSVGLSDKRLKEVALSDKNFVSFDYVYAVLRRIMRLQNPKYAPVVDALRERAKFGDQNLPKPDELRVLFQSVQLENTDLSFLIDDYQYYLETGRMRNPQLFLEK